MKELDQGRSIATRVRGLLAATAFLGVTLAAGQACQVSLAPNTIACPPLEDFPKVSQLLEQRCGTLDCHGNDARPLRIYSQYGLRFVGDDETGEIYSGNLAAPTTEEEIARNYFAVCGLEPEKMAFVQVEEADPEELAEELTLVRKPRLTEKHKGGRIWDRGKVEDRCLVNWIAADYEPGAMNLDDCNEALGL